ncbi:MAG: hypothetical protein AB1429_14765 [Pseudomonadota bacterium]|jgi:hypothetical protein
MTWFNTIVLALPGEKGDGGVNGPDRLAAAAGAAALHLALLAWLLLHPAGARIPVGADGRNGTGSALVMLAQPQSPPKAKAPVQRKLRPIASALTSATSIAPPQTEPSLADTLDTFTPSVADAAPGAPCDLANAFARDLNQSPAARAALDAVPAATRSVANAIMLWDGAWGAETDAGGRGVLRQILIREIQSSRSDCREERHQGPVLFFGAGAGASISVVVGSGVWRWSDLLS